MPQITWATTEPFHGVSQPTPPCSNNISPQRYTRAFRLLFSKYASTESPQMQQGSYRLHRVCANASPLPDSKSSPTGALSRQRSVLEAPLHRFRTTMRRISSSVTHGANLPLNLKVKSKMETLQGMEPLRSRYYEAENLEDTSDYRFIVRPPNNSNHFGGMDCRVVTRLNIRYVLIALRHVADNPNVIEDQFSDIWHVRQDWGVAGDTRISAERREIEDVQRHLSYGNLEIGNDRHVISNPADAKSAAWRGQEESEEQRERRRSYFKRSVAD